MKYHKLTGLLLALGLVFLSACQKGQLTPFEEEVTLRLTLQGGIVPFEADGGTRAAPVMDWAEGDRIFVRTQGKSTSSVATATLGADGTWYFRYKGSLTDISRVQCYFFEAAQSYNDYEVLLTYDSIIYEDNAASLTVDGDGYVTLTTWLRPKTGRIRFRGDADQSIGISGLCWYTAFELDSFTFSSSSEVVSDFRPGTDRYFYGFFAEDSDRKLTLNDDFLYFSRIFGEEVLRPGASGYLDIPTHESYDNWTVENPEGFDAYIPVEIPDENFRTWLLERFDTNQDGMLSVLEGKNITEIENDRCDNVASLAGIEYFSNLRRLVWNGYGDWKDGELVVYGRLTEVDLSHNTELYQISLRENQISSIDFSKNLLLRQINIDGNRITSLDVSGLENLEDLRCCNSPQLSSLNLSGCSNLKFLYCYQSFLSELNVLACPELQELWCADNHLTHLDLTGLSKLEVLHCTGNDFSSSGLDLIHCPSLRELYCHGNKLTHLDLTNNPELDYIECQKNLLSELDLSACRKLRYLRCWKNNLTRLDLTGLSFLEDLNCSQNDFSSEGLDLTPCPSLRYLWCNENRLAYLDLSANPQLEELGCYDNPLTGVLDLTANGQLRRLDSFNCPYLEEIWIPSGLYIPELNHDDHTQIIGK